jgi:hypothetical protein
MCPSSRLHAVTASVAVLLFSHPVMPQLKTLDRNFEPVVVPGWAFPEFDAASISIQSNELFLYAYRANSQTWEQIPFQFDERNLAGGYFNPNIDEVAGLDDNDELVFMAKDAGDRNLVSWIDNLESRGFVRYEIRLLDPLAPDKIAWVYLYRTRTLGFAPNLADYIQYFEPTNANLAADKIVSPFYELTNAANGFPQDLVIPVSAGGSGVDLLDRLKFRARASLIVNVNINEDNIRFEVGRDDSVRVREGRVRVIRELEATLVVDIPVPFVPDQIFPFSTPPVFYYPYSARVEIRVPTLGDASVSSGRMSFDLNENAVGMKFVSANNPEPGFTVDGAANETPNRQVDNVLPGNNWVYVNGAQGTFVHRFPLQTNVGGKRDLYFKDNSGNDNGDTGDRKSYGDVGIDITEGISPPFTLSYQGYFLDKNQPSSTGSQIAAFEQNPIELEFAPQDFGSVPVELVAFNATVDEQTVYLEWLTATESNNFGFDVERRFVDADWRKIDFVPGHGTTVEPARYEYVDRNLQSGVYEYRLKQIDTDGAFEFSSVVTAVVGLPTTFVLAQNFPNPFNPTTEIQYELAYDINNPNGSRTILKIYNILGREVRTLVNDEQPPGFYRVPWDGTDDFGQRLTSGIYIYRLQSGSFTATRKMAFVQ